MSDQPPIPRPNQQFQPALIIYILYAVGIFIPFTALAGVVYAYVERGKDPALDSHLTLQINTFWIGLAAMVVGFILAFILIGFLVWLVWVLWLAVRIITGIQLAQAGEPVRGTEVMGMKLI